MSRQVWWWTLTSQNRNKFFTASSTIILRFSPLLQSLKTTTAWAVIAVCVITSIPWDPFWEDSLVGYWQKQSDIRSNREPRRRLTILQDLVRVPTLLQRRVATRLDAGARTHSSRQRRRFGTVPDFIAPSDGSKNRLLTFEHAVRESGGGDVKSFLSQVCDQEFT